MKIMNNMVRAVDVDDLKDGEIFYHPVTTSFYLKLDSDYHCYKRYFDFASKAEEAMIDNIAKNLDTLNNRKDVAVIVKKYTCTDNAVDLMTGTLTYVSGPVTPVNGKLVIE